jgi:hypothetical protein
MPVNTNNVLYWSDTLLDNTPGLSARIRQTSSSGFTSVLLWSLHVNAANAQKGIALGDFHWNDTALVVTQNGQAVFDPGGVFTQLASSLNALLQGGTVTKIFFSIGSGGTTDFATITSLISTAAGQTLLKNNFSALLKALPMVTGFDFDDEDDYKVNTIAWLTEMLATSYNTTITYCPYWDQHFWEQCLEQVYHDMGKQPVAWWNLQCYSGGLYNQPLGWVNYVKSNQKANGVANPNTFIVPGYAAMNSEGDGPGMCPPDICNTLSPFRNAIQGAFIWNSGHIFQDGTGLCNGGTATVSQYAAAITNGLNGNCS